MDEPPDDWYPFRGYTDEDKRRNLEEMQRIYALEDQMKARVRATVDLEKTQAYKIAHEELTRGGHNPGARDTVIHVLAASVLSLQGVPVGGNPQLHDQVGQRLLREVDRRVNPGNANILRDVPEPKRAQNMKVTKTQQGVDWKTAVGVAAGTAALGTAAYFGLSKPKTKPKPAVRKTRKTRRS